MNACGITRLLLPAYLAGWGMATVTGNDLFGWVAAGLALGVAAMVQTVRGTGGACAVPARTEAVEVAAERSGDEPQPGSRS